MTATDIADDRVTRRQNLAAVSNAYDKWAELQAAWIADTVAELEEGDEARERVAELEIRVGELEFDLSEAQKRAMTAESELARVRSQRDTANVAPRTGW